jgi:hypothetical protein
VEDSTLGGDPKVTGTCGQRRQLLGQCGRLEFFGAGAPPLRKALFTIKQVVGVVSAAVDLRHIEEIQHVFGLLLRRARAGRPLLVVRLGDAAKQRSVFVKNEDSALLKHGNVLSRGDHALYWPV